MSFAQQTASFFDELSQIMESNKKDQEEEMERQNEHPFSNQLTQDEEPTQYNPAPAEGEAEVITRGGAT